MKTSESAQRSGASSHHKDRRKRQWNGRGSSNELPGTAKEIAEVIGREATLQLAARVKHEKLYVPASYKMGHWIVETIGEPLALKLSKMFRGESLDLAKCHAIGLYERNARMRHAFLRGTTVQDLRRQYNMSLRAVQYVLSPVRAVERQTGA